MWTGDTGTTLCLWPRVSHSSSHSLTQVEVILLLIWETIHFQAHTGVCWQASLGGGHMPHYEDTTWQLLFPKVSAQREKKMGSRGWTKYTALCYISVRSKSSPNPSGGDCPRVWIPESGIFGIYYTFDPQIEQIIEFYSGCSGIICLYWDHIKNLNSIGKNNFIL